MVSVSQGQRINLSFQRWNKIHFQEKEIELVVTSHITIGRHINGQSLQQTGLHPLQICLKSLQYHSHK